MEFLDLVAWSPDFDASILHSLNCLWHVHSGPACCTLRSESSRRERLFGILQLRFLVSKRISLLVHATADLSLCFGPDYGRFSLNYLRFHELSVDLCSWNKLSRSSSAFYQAFVVQR